MQATCICEPEQPVAHFSFHYVHHELFIACLLVSFSGKNYQEDCYEGFRRAEEEQVNVWAGSRIKGQILTF